ncbi:MAG TPA: ferritin-like domain-containing protein [Leeuwenhoekiella sp.]|nr:ferritin-like domain-containing protein [Leeuwenhoekiella sp.]
MKRNEIKENGPEPLNGRDRRKFLKLSGMALVGGGLLLSCSDDDDMGMVDPDPDPMDDDPMDPEVFDLGSGNLGILNYAFALEQLEAAFYEEVLKGDYYAGASAEEKAILEDTTNHEIIHREFFKAAISGAVSAEQVLPDLEFDFSTGPNAVDFSSRDSVLATAVALEDTGVSAYNGAGKLIDVSDEAGVTYLGLAGKIVSVEARHASAFRDLVSPNTSNFASDDILVGLDTDPAFDKATAPADVIAAVLDLQFIVTEFTANNLPTA